MANCRSGASIIPFRVYNTPSAQRAALPLVDYLRMTLAALPAGYRSLGAGAANGARFLADFLARLQKMYGRKRLKLSGAELLAQERNRD